MCERENGPSKGTIVVPGNESDLVVGEEDGEEYYYEIEDDDEYETVADAFIDRLQDIFEIEEKN